MLDPGDKEWLHLTMENAALKAMDLHREKEHIPMETKLDDTRKMIYGIGGLSAALGAALSKWLPGGN